MITHTCKYCNYTSNYKNTYDRHCKSQKHKNIMILSIQNEMLKKKTTNIIKDVDTSGNNILINKIDNLAKKNEELQKKIEQLEKINNQNTHTIVK